MDQGSDRDGEHISGTRARAGTTPHMTRYVLGWGLALILAIFLILLLIYY